MVLSVTGVCIWCNSESRQTALTKTLGGLLSSLLAKQHSGHSDITPWKAWGTWVSISINFWNTKRHSHSATQSTFPAMCFQRPNIDWLTVTFWSKSSSTTSETDSISQPMKTTKYTVVQKLLFLTPAKTVIIFTNCNKIIGFHVSNWQLRLCWPR